MYKNNSEIVDFISRAQAKIMDLGTLLLQDSDEDGLDLALALFRAVELITDKDCSLSEASILQMVHYWTNKADLFEVPLLYIPGFEYQIGIGGGTTTGAPFVLPPHRHPISDIDGIDIYIDKLVRQKLAELMKNQLDDVEYAWVQNGARPMVQPTLSLEVKPSLASGNGWYEKGISMPSSTLVPSVNVNGGGAIRAVRLFINGTKVADRADGSLSVYADNIARYNTTNYRLEVDFEKVGTRSTEVNLNFMAPSYHAVIAANATFANVKTGTKQMRFKQTELSILFGVNGEGNKPAFAFPSDWGAPFSIKTGGFETLKNWRIWEEEITLHADSKTTQKFICGQSTASHNQGFTYTFYFR